jgi:hypothetical protein
MEDEDMTMERFISQVTADYHVAKLTREDERKIQRLEDELGCTLIAYRRKLQHQA